MSGNEELEGIERRLRSADFSAESRVRPALRARLLRRAAAAGGSPRSAARTAVFAAVVVAVLAPVLRLIRRAPDAWSGRAAAAYPLGPRGLPVLPGRFAPSAEEPPAPLFRSVRGREVAVDGGKAVVWEFESGEVRLETRRVAPEEIFDTPHGRGVL